MFRVYYNPNAPYATGEHCLHQSEDESEALSAAVEFSNMYYGEKSKIWVKQGRKKIYEI